MEEENTIEFELPNYDRCSNGEEENTIEFELPNFAGHGCSNGEARRGELKADPKSGPLQRRLANSFLLSIYPNGNRPENADYVSIAFDIAFSHLERRDNLDEMKRYREDTVLLVCVLSIVDLDGSLRFSQSLGVHLEEGPRNVLPVDVDRFVRRRVLLDASEELLPSDILKLRCDVRHFFSVGYCENQSYTDFCNYVTYTSIRESWFTETKDGSLALDLRNLDSSLWTKLRKRSHFFRGLFQSNCKEMEEGCMPIEEYEYHGFRDMFGYVLFGSVLHLRYYHQYEDVYNLARVYGVRDLEEICIEFFREHLTEENAIETMRIADARGDLELRAIAFEKVLAEWKVVRRLQCWKDLCREWPPLADELLGAARNLDLENADSLSNLGAVNVHDPRRAMVMVQEGDRRFYSYVQVRRGEVARKCEDNDYDFYR